MFHASKVHAVSTTAINTTTATTAVNSVDMDVSANMLADDLNRFPEIHTCLLVVTPSNQPSAVFPTAVTATAAAAAATH